MSATPSLIVRGPLLNIHRLPARDRNTLTAATATMRAASGTLSVQQPSPPEAPAMVWTFEHTIPAGTTD
jgi:hypothetical protein